MTDLIKFEPFSKVFTGKPDLKTDHISNSGLSEIKRVLLSGRPFLGDEKYLIFGSELHCRFLINQQNQTLSEPEEFDICNMINSLNRNLFVSMLMKNSQREIIDFGLIEGILFKWIGDIVFRKVGADIKTTSAKTEREFINLALTKYDYLRQGWCYRTAGELKDFYFIGIQKHEPYNVYILNTKDYEKEERKIVKETRFLLDIFRNYGRVKQPEQPSPTGTGTKSPSNSEREIARTGTSPRTFSGWDD